MAPKDYREVRSISTTLSQNGRDFMEATDENS